jgi:septal ring factor EnvC (AmiA/AmiB activator)
MPPKRKNNNKSTETADDSDEELFSLTMVKRLMAQQESAFKTVIESLIKSTTERVDGLVKQVVELKASLEYSQRDIEENQKSAKQNEQTIAAITAQLNDTKNLMNKCQEKNTYLENQSRRNNIRVYGVEEKPRETWEETEAALKSILIEKLQLPSEPRIERAHRNGKPIPNQMDHQGRDPGQ